jgi:hypothetical protein
MSPVVQICAANTLRMAVGASAAKFVKVTVTGVFPGSPGPALQFVGVETVVGELTLYRFIALVPLPHTF